MSLCTSFEERIKQFDQLNSKKSIIVFDILFIEFFIGTFGSKERSFRSFVGKPKYKSSKKQPGPEARLDFLNQRKAEDGGSNVLLNESLSSCRATVDRCATKDRTSDTISLKYPGEKLELSLELLEGLESLLGPEFGPELNDTIESSNKQTRQPDTPERISPQQILKQVHDSFGSNDKKHKYGNTPQEQSIFSLTYEEENTMLKHFFKKLLPLLDAHPNSPWPELALKYCEFDIARSCFISLACIHIYESKKGGPDFYNKGVAHINMTLEYLLDFIKSNSKSQSQEHIKDIDSRAKRVTSFAILLLINVHILFAVLENGKSRMVRLLFRIFASICENPAFVDELLVDNDNNQSELLDYRKYVAIHQELKYVSNLKGAQCWALAVYVTLTKVVQPESYDIIIRKLVNEFISVYSSMDPSSPIVTQMVWPIYAIGCECKSRYERNQMSVFMDRLYENAQMGTLFSLRYMVYNVWDTGLTSEECLAEWLDNDEDYLPL
ncbi:uncharacterized protein CANTADRAFT_8566 [Suhomyces tanzawaensis NRRL Y-17324]|uniref:Fungal-specific transcription factor domain-containing protein n=1 Tax=Suhomyces tanzawaensis NRRL Y-17324 TaxID=984487 RepID=A0A1E4SAY9_9ASCO|nr:uncharacterized protein CANTADRAFT_8566 [Suhomyces tanzawaensis NRRL Y-17324]ODV76674.1 hypothetical protein CANTADRAFT_8566 [Suhomyces tanzawaensis NRRL Y-17324]